MNRSRKNVATQLKECRWPRIAGGLLLSAAINNWFSACFLFWADLYSPTIFMVWLIYHDCKPIRAPELHIPMIQFLIKVISNMHTQCSWWFKQSNWSGIFDCDIYYIHRTRQWKLSKTKSVLWTGYFAKVSVSEFFWKYKNVLVLMILKVRKVFMVFEQHDLIIVKWFTVADFLYAQNNVCHNRAKLTRLLCHCFANLWFPQKTNCAYKYGYVYGVQLQCRLYWFQIHLFNFTANYSKA